ncbi:MAG: DNA polymerase III subunit delta' [Paludibacteraceae bacterium]|nr:DNA polymerase III subunit delta' [Paludibacteraceae bacterium]MBR6830453.1 DNA polymerase III subunit delta' [Paludibacteraceae bacterium]
MLFKEIIGQEEVKRQLCASVREGRIPHAQLFTGISGIGKLQLALAYAQYVNCPHRTEEDSCGTCPTCLQFQHLQHPDLHFVFPIVKTDAGDTCDDFLEPWRQIVRDKRYFDLNDWHEALGVETKQSMIYEKESGEILRKLSLKAYGDGYKVMIIWQPEKMNADCANKLLKILEEPAPKTLFLMVSEHPEQLLSTIQSRVQTIRVPRLETDEIAGVLRTQGIDATKAQDIARIANGSYLAAVKKLDETEANKQELRDFIALFRDAYTVGVLSDPEKKYESLKRLRQWSLDMADSKVGRERQKHFLQYAQQQVRENFIRNAGEPELNYQMEAERDFSVKFAPFIHPGNVEAIMNQLSLAERQIEQNGNAKMIFFDLCLQMIVLIKIKRK